MYINERNDKGEEGRYLVKCKRIGEINLVYAERSVMDVTYYENWWKDIRDLKKTYTWIAIWKGTKWPGAARKGIMKGFREKKEFRLDMFNNIKIYKIRK